jgi:hypothetical protein
MHDFEVGKISPSMYVSLGFEEQLGFGHGNA